MILLLAAGLSMDAFAVSVTNGMCRKMPVMRNAVASGFAFGFFQGLMPFLGYLGGSAFTGVIQRFDHWLALLLLSFIGARMIRDAVAGGGADDRGATEKPFSFKLLMLQALATSVDALAVGVSLGVMGANIFHAAGLIASVTFMFSFSGVLVGKRFGGMLKDKAEILGGVILILIGARIFVEHMGIV